MIRETQVKLATLKESCDQGRVEMEDDELALPGFRFHPTDEELVSYYLRRKVNKKPISLEIIRDVDIYKHEPWDLPRMGTVGEKEMYFFCMRGGSTGTAQDPTESPEAASEGDRNRSTHTLPPRFRRLHWPEEVPCLLSRERRERNKDRLVDARIPPPLHSFLLRRSSKIITSKITRRNVSSNKYGKQLSSKEACNGGGRSPTGSSSEMGNLGHDRGEEKRLGGSNFFQQDEVFTEKYVEENCKPCEAGLWDVYSQSEKELFREENWDEIGRMVDYMLEPTITYDCYY
ncbi:hypothetical protein HPP92_000818 [Vanilla planifolia]|uniref:NAC domain-containing protein n=1 Tax=Vanilla planifolia TaxID=51239 RepID=A0A835S6H5_VANPL|nr:hypothetical protein HPP92_000818 [Vanilla planifolia]